MSIFDLAALGVSLVALGALLYFGYRKYRARGYMRVSSRIRPVLQRHENYERGLPTTANWENIELDAVMASMEATTAL